MSKNKIALIIASLFATTSVFAETNIQAPQNVTQESNLFVLEDIKTYYDSLYQKEPNQKIFMFAKDNLRHYIKKYSEILNIPRIRVHDLRHSYASYLLQKNVSILAISKQLGHKDVKLTLSIYSHLLPEANDYLKEILNNMNK